MRDTFVDSLNEAFEFPDTSLVGHGKVGVRHCLMTHKLMLCSAAVAFGTADYGHPEHHGHTHRRLAVRETVLHLITCVWRGAWRPQPLPPNPRWYDHVSYWPRRLRDVIAGALIFIMVGVSAPSAIGLVLERVGAGYLPCRVVRAYPRKMLLNACATVFRRFLRSSSARSRIQAI